MTEVSLWLNINLKKDLIFTKIIAILNNKKDSTIANHITPNETPVRENVYTVRHLTNAQVNRYQPVVEKSAQLCSKTFE